MNKLKFFNNFGFNPFSLIFLLLPTMLVQPIALAKTNDDINFDWNADFTVGLINDSNVAIDEIDRDASQGDSATTWSAKVGSKFQLTKQVDLRASASLRDKSFHDFDQFDLRTTLISLQSSYDFSSFKLGGGIRDISTDLASENFLSNQHLYLFATHRANRSWFFRGELNFADKEFDIEPNRNTSRERIGIDAYYFLDDTKKYWTIGLQLADESSDTNNDQFSRNNSSLKIKYSQLLPIYERDIRMEAQARYQSRNYDAIDPRIGEIRDDNRFRAKISAEVPLSKNWFVTGEYEYSDYSSNLPSADYSQNLFAINVRWSLDEGE